MGLLSTLMLAVVGCGGVSEGETGPRVSRTSGTVYSDVTLASGITHVHEKPLLDPVLGNIMSWMASVGAAAAAGDYDSDGWIDLYVTSSRKGSPNRLYRNNGDGTFTDVGAEAGVADVNDDDGTSMDAIWADMDNDGRVDLYVVRWGRDILFRNEGDGRFRDVTSERFRTASGAPGTDWANGNGVIAWDYDLDGRLDLYVGNYFRDVDLWNLDSTLIMHDDFEIARNAGANFVYHQESDGTFTEVARDLELGDTGWTLAVGSADLNNDGWPDLYCANDFGPDQLFLNLGQSRFINATEHALGEDTKKGMNVDFGDFNNDGWADIYVTNITTDRYLQEGNMLWRNNGPDADGRLRFMDISPEAATFDGGWGWGAKFLDYDLDGDLDLFTVNGFISAGEGSYWYDLATWTVGDLDPADSRNWPEIGDRSFSGYETFRFWRNEGSETFQSLATEVGLDSDRDGRGVVSFDYDNDGDMDLFVANQGQPPHLYRNGGAEGKHWILVRLETEPGKGVTADAIGARVTVVTEHLSQFRERDGGTGYAGQSDPRLHFGLGDDDHIRLLEVRWPDGGFQYLEDVPVDRIVTVQRNPADYVRGAKLSVEPPEPRERHDAPSPQMPQMPPEVLEQLLTKMEASLREDASQHELAYKYRQRAVENGKHDRPIAFFTELVARDPDDIGARLELSVAYVDKIPSRGGIAAIVSKGTLARKSLDQLNWVIEQDDRSWIAHYGRGMNHLHWPKALRHTSDAVADFRRCLELQRGRDGEGGPHYYERTFVLLGDALTKNESYVEAREVWREGLERYPTSAELKLRLELRGDDAQYAFVEGLRSLEQPIYTDFSFVTPSP
jgi:tetratricopeptide (TPR) repeat protein